MYDAPKRQRGWIWKGGIDSSTPLHPSFGRVKCIKCGRVKIDLGRVGRATPSMSFL